MQRSSLRRRTASLGRSDDRCIGCPAGHPRRRRLRSPLLVHGSVLDVDIEEHRVTCSVRRGDPVTAHHYGKEFTAVAGPPVSFSGDYHTHDAAPGPAPSDTA
ncbi:glycosyl hydrolase family 65 protein [Dactylosporangium sp. NPDC005572]|uniref:glycosyl hydrolase family 65 protein n=1 Tax=Dactylosporangium sp. NPDC005572 TaxID=3156889 RepID=UPI0033A3F7DF